MRASGSQRSAIATGAGAEGRGAPGAGRFASWRYGVAVATLGAACYLNTLANDFTFDDEVIVVQSERIRDLGNWREIWLTDWWRVDSLTFVERNVDRFYRPLTVATFAVNYAIGELHAFDYHLVNLLLHGAITWFVWLALGRLERLTHGDIDGSVALVGAVLFAAHPIHVEVVASVVGRADLLAAFGVSSGLLCYLSDLQRPRRSARIGTALCLLAGLLAKESGVILLGWIVLTEFWIGRDRRRRLPVLCSALLIALVVYLALRAIACQGLLLKVGHTGPMDNPLVDSSPAQRFWTPFKLLAFYLWLMVWPATLSADYSYNALPLADGPSDPWAAAGAALVVAGALCVIRGWKRRAGAGLAILMACCAYAPFCNGPKLIGTILGERLFFVASIPVCWLAAKLLVHAVHAISAWPAAPRRTYRLLFGITSALVIALGARTFVRNRDWRDGPTLFAAALRSYPRATRMRLAVGRQLLKRGDREEALRQFRAALEISPQPIFYVAEARALAALGRLDEAEASAATAVRVSPLDAEFTTLLADIRRSRGKRDALMPNQTVADAEARAAAEPNDFEAQYQLGLTCAHAGDPVGAVKAFELAVKLDPDRDDARLELAVHLVHLDRIAEAVVEFERLLARGPKNWRAHANLAVAFAKLGRDEAALRHAQEAHVLAPDQMETIFNLAQIHALLGHRDEALGLLRRFRDRLPSSDPDRLLTETQIRRIEDAK